MDEPTGGLDVSVQARLLDLLRSLVREMGLSAIIVTHDLAVVRLLADRLMVMKDGYVVESGLTDQVLDDPQHAYTQIPVIMLSARAEEVDRVRGLETGADDYVVKPYSVIEFAARVKAHFRRANVTAAGNKLTHDDIVVDLETYKVYRSDLEIKLGPTEFKLLAKFMEKPGRVWQRDQLLDRVWGQEIYVDTRTVDVHIGRLRRALKQHGGQDPIRTVRGAGYALG